MNDNAKMISLTAMCETATEVGTAQLQMQQAADVLRAQGITHSVGYVEVEEGPDPSVWLDRATGAIITRIPDATTSLYKCVSLTFVENIPKLGMLCSIEEEWEVLA